MPVNSLDYLILALLGISALLGFYRGFLSVLGGLASTLIALFVAVIYRNELALYLEKKFGLDMLLSQAIADKIPQPAWSSSPAGSLLPSLKTLPVVQEQLANFAHLILVVLAFLVIYIIISKGLRLIWKVLEAPFRSGVLGGINRLIGLILLAGKDLMIMAVVLGILYPFVKTGAGMGWTGFIDIRNLVDKSSLAPYLFDIFAGLERLLGISV